MGKAEAFVEGYAVKEATDFGAVVRKLEWVNSNFAPDRFFAYDGRVALVEFKSPKGTLSEGQKIEIQELRNRGVFVYVIDNRKDADIFLRWLKGAPVMVPVYA